MSLPTKLYHYSDEPLGELVPNFYGKDYHRWAFPKPVGLWVSIEDYEEDETWKTWCEEEKFNLECLTYKSLIKLKPCANILHLSSAEDVFECSKKYPNLEFAARFQLPIDKCVRSLDWTVIAEQYDGIFIAPYQWSCRMSSAGWYYGWDCASGCIWNIDAIESVTLQETKALQEVGSD